MCDEMATACLWADHYSSGQKRMFPKILLYISVHLGSPKHAAFIPGVIVSVFIKLTTRVKTHKLLQVCSQVVNKLCSHCLFLDLL